jgi:hypothetical protein
MKDNCGLLALQQNVALNLRVQNWKRLTYVVLKGNFLRYFGLNPAFMESVAERYHLQDLSRLLGALQTIIDFYQ